MDNPAPEGADQEVAVLLNTVLQQPWDRKAHCQVFPLSCMTHHFLLVYSLVLIQGLSI